MNDVVIRVENLGKRYRLGESHGKLGVLGEALSGGARLRRPGGQDRASGNGETFWALRDVSFEVRRGEVMGIVGRNGAGKSTLLKILSRITEPSSGCVRVRGRVGSLLEVGTGFHPELTGRENIFLNGAILGMKRSEIERRFDEIVSFAEVERFIDTPVKRYSSGMYVRLAFAVAAHLEPEILLVDEVLAVGDFAFQKKCLSKMSDVASEGRTILFVSHNLAALNSLCQRCILLQAGQQIMEGSASGVVGAYLQTVTGSSSEQVWPDDDTAPGDHRARIGAVRIVDGGGQPQTQIRIEDPVVIEVDYRVRVPGTVLNVSISLFNQEDVYVLASPSTSDREWFKRPHPPGFYRSRCTIPAAFLNEGRYSVTALLVENGANIIAQIDRVVSVDMVDLGDGRSGWFGRWGGAVRPALEWTTRCLPNC